jgi:hypothetical protein
MAAASYSRMRLDELLTRVIELGGDGLEIEYKDGYEEITAMKGNFGSGSAGSSPEAGKPLIFERSFGPCVTERNGSRFGTLYTRPE